jgi:hypothetical protein
VTVSIVSSSAQPITRLTFARLMVCGRCTTICDAACSPFASGAAMSTLVMHELTADQRQHGDGRELVEQVGLDDQCAGRGFP